MKVNQFQPYIGKEEYESIKECFDANWITEGPKAKEFSEKLCKLIGCKYGVFAPNGTLSIYLGLKALGIGPGDEVIVPDFTFIASANAVEMVGATPVFVDIDKDTLHIDLEKCADVVNKNTKAIMPVHIYGTAVNMDSLMKFAQLHKLKVIEDAAQAIGVTWNGTHCGSFGDVGSFSFFADKTITTGEGGFVCTNDETIYKQLLYIRNQGRLNRGSFEHPEIGYNFRMTDIQCAIGLTQLKKLDTIIEKKQTILQIYKNNLHGVNGIKIIEPVGNSNHIPFRVAILFDRKITEIMNYLSNSEIETRTFFYPIHKQPCYISCNCLKNNCSDFPNSTYVYEHGLCMPSYPELKESEIIYVCDKLKESLHMNENELYCFNNNLDPYMQMK
jgi:perosamine synthetase